MANTLEFFDASKAHSLTFQYEENTERLRTVVLTERKNQGRQRQVQISQIWINNIPASFLSRIEHVKLPQGPHPLTLGEDGRLHLSFQNASNIAVLANSELLPQARCKQYSIIPSLLTVVDLKRFIKENSKILSEITEFDFLVEGAYLRDSHTLDECGVGDQTNIVLEFAVEQYKDSALQAGTRDIVTTKHFKEFVAELPKCIGFVCKIQTSAHYGTGFLIGKSLIMTNAHVIADIIPNENNQIPATITFFDEEGESQQVVFNSATIVYRSPQAREGETIGRARLDFAILSLKSLDNWKENVQALRMLQLAKIASACFNIQSIRAEEQTAALANNHNSDDIRQRVLARRDQRLLTRANIIQHPNEGTKQIAFRENRVIDTDAFLVHYESRTAQGTSGAPVIDDRGRFVGLHVKTCDLIKQTLLRNLPRLLLWLGLGELGKDYGREEGAYVGFKKDPKLVKVVLASGVYELDSDKNASIEEKKKLRRTILDLIKEKKGGERPYTEWVAEFLRSIGDKTDPRHLECNAAVLAERIFTNLRADNPAMVVIRQAQTFKWIDSFVPRAIQYFKQRFLYHAGYAAIACGIGGIAYKYFNSGKVKGH